jgi:hypothetical protein
VWRRTTCARRRWNRCSWPSAGSRSRQRRAVDCLVNARAVGEHGDYSQTPHLPSTGISRHYVIHRHPCSFRVWVFLFSLILHELSFFFCKCTSSLLQIRPFAVRVLHSEPPCVCTQQSADSPLCAAYDVRVDNLRMYAVLMTVMHVSKETSKFLMIFCTYYIILKFCQ